jgi:predicted CoA-binding protein
MGIGGGGKVLASAPAEDAARGDAHLHLIDPDPTMRRVRRRPHDQTARRTMADWRENLVTSGEEIGRLLREVKRVAVLGIKTEAQPHQPAFYVPEYLQRAGYEVIPVPVYFPDATTILGQRVYRAVADIPGGVDMVNVFRRGVDVPPHVDDIIAAKPKLVWMQSGIRNEQAAQRFAEAGIKVIQDRCAMVEHRQHVR